MRTRNRFISDGVGPGIMLAIGVLTCRANQSSCSTAKPGTTESGVKTSIAFRPAKVRRFRGGKGEIPTVVDSSVLIMRSKPRSANVVASMPMFWWACFSVAPRKLSRADHLSAISVNRPPLARGAAVR